MTPLVNHSHRRPRHAQQAICLLFVKGGDETWKEKDRGKGLCPSFPRYTTSGSSGRAASQTAAFPASGADDQGCAFEKRSSGHPARSRLASTIAQTRPRRWITGNADGKAASLFASFSGKGRKSFT